MLNTPWMDPRDVDWTQPLNPLRIPGWRINNNPFANAAMNGQFTQALGNGSGLEPRIYVCPDRSNQVIPANSTYDYEVPSDPNTWLWAFNASGTGEDFLIQITDSGTGATLFSQPTPMSLLNQARTGTNGRGVQILLSTPHLYQPPSYPIVRVVNTNAFAQTCAVTLFCASELDQ